MTASCSRRNTVEMCVLSLNSFEETHVARRVAVPHRQRVCRYLNNIKCQSPFPRHRQRSSTLRCCHVSHHASASRPAHFVQFCGKFFIKDTLHCSFGTVFICHIGIGRKVYRTTGAKLTKTKSEERSGSSVDC